ncbi:MAG TPA: choice-of-anchor D domain-containing protein [Candidatus Angelobacter sp.]
MNCFKRTHLSLAVIVALFISVSTAAFGQTAASSSTRPTSGQRIWLQENQLLPVQHVASGLSKGQGMMTVEPGVLTGLGQSQPVSMAAGDVDGDGFEDLVVGYSSGGRGFISIHRGNMDAFAPQSDASFKAIGRGQFPSPFHLEAKTFGVPVSSDFIALGNFTGQGNQDLVVAAKGGSALYIFPNDGKGNFGTPQTVNVAGGITALAAGKLGHTGTLVVAGARLLTVYVSTAQGLTALASYPVSAPVSNILFGDFGDPGLDVAFLSGGKIQILRSSTMQLTTVALPVTVRAFALGSFIYNRNYGQQIALVAPDGSIQIAVRNEFDSRVYTVAEFQAIRQAKMKRQPAPAFVPAASFPTNGWKIVESFAGAAALGANQTPLIFRTRISINGADDVMVLNAFSGQLTLISHGDGQPGAQTFQSGQVSLRPYSGTPIAALPMRLNVDGRLGVMALHSNEVAPSLMVPIPDPNFFVNTDNDPTPTSPIANACNNTSFTDLTSSCSLREAVLKANGDTINLQAGHTYSLTIGRGATQDYTGNTGALYVNQTATIVGGNQNTTIIQWGTPSSGTVDMVMAVNQDISIISNATASLSNLTIQNGVNHGTQGNDGDGGCMEFDTGSSGTATLTLTNVTLQNCSTLQGGGGGLVIFNFVTPAGGGGATISNSIIQGNSVVASGQAGNGGGIAINLDAHMTMTASQVKNNSAVQNCTPTCGLGDGGGISAFAPQNVSATTAESFIHSSIISGNKSAGFGGGINSSASFSIDTGTVISGNTAGTDGSNPTAHANQEGGGFYSNPTSPCPLSSTCTTTLSKVTITGNTATGNGGGISHGNASAGTTGSLTMSFSRLAGNTTSGGSGSNLNNNNATATVTNNWWGTNAAAATINTVVASGGTTTFDPFIVLTHTASPNKIRINQSSTLTGDMSKDNHGSGASLAGNLDVLVGLPITFNNAVLGTIAQAQPEALGANAQATATYNAGGAGGNGSADATVDQQTVTAPITVLQPPSITKSFNPTTVTPNTPSTITFSITNGNTVTIDSSFADTLPANLVVATPPNASNTCGGTLTATAGAGSISFANPSLAAGTCTIQVNVQSAVDNVYSNSVTINSADAGNGNTSSANLTVINAPTIAKAFGAATIPLNGTTSLTFTLSSTNTNLTLNGVAFTDNLPAGLVVATPGNLNNTCGGTATAANGSSSVTLTGASLGAGASCTVSVTVQGTTSGAKNNSVQVTSTNGGTGNTSNASITVISPPTISKAFGATSIPLNGSTLLTFTLSNPNSSNTLTGIGFSDTLPAGLIISTPNGLTTTCTGTITATQGTNVISLSGGTLAATASCSLSVSVTGIAAGTQNNTTGAVTSTEGGTGGTASASITVVAPPTTTKSFSPGGIQPNGTSTMTITITNPPANTVALTNLTFTDNFPANVVVATPNGLTNTCGGTATAVAGSGTVSLTGGTVAVNTSCTVSANVTSAFTGSYLNDTGPVSSGNGGTGADATATLGVAFPPTISKLFLPDNIPNGATTLLSFTINNPDSNSVPPNSDVTLTGISFTDNLPAGVVVANPNNLSNSCDGTVTATPGSSTITLTGGDLGPAVGLMKIKPLHPLPMQPQPLLQPLQPLQPKATGPAFRQQVPKSGSIIVRGGPQQPQSSNGSCFISVEVQATSTGTKNNTTGPISANESGPGATSNTATLTVTAAPTVVPPTIAKAFGASTIPLNGTTSLTLTFGNPNSSTNFTNVQADDPLPSGLVVASPNGLGGTCLGDGATVFANPGSNDINTFGTSLLANTSCTVIVNVTGTTSGVKNNTTGNVSATYAFGDTDQNITGGTASASILVVLPPVIAKAFNPSSIAQSQTTSLGFTITNPAANPVALTGVGFTDVLPAGLTVANGSATVCGGTLTTSGGNTISLSGATIAVSGTCSFSVTVTPTAFGNFTNTTGNVTSNEGGTGNTATATLTVAPIVISPTSVDFGDVDSDQAAAALITITNNGNTAVPLSISLTPGTGANANNFFFATNCLIALPAHQSCQVGVAFVAPHVTSTAQLGVSTATLNVTSSSFTQHVPLKANVIDPEPQFTPSSLNFGTHTVNTSTTLTTVLKNVGLSALNIQSITIGGANPADFTAQSFCPASLSPGSSCNINVTFKPLVKGNRSATLVLTSNDGTTTVPLTGRGK